MLFQPADLGKFGDLWGCQVSITTLSDWGKVELAAQTHELNQVETPPLPQITERNICDIHAIYDKLRDKFAWSTVRCAQLQTSLHRKDKALAECRMWLSVGDTQRAQEVLNRGLVDL